MPKAGVRVYAHRGASRELPENTMAAFRRALELGADALETDLHATADGVLVTSHDPDGARVFGVARPMRPAGPGRSAPALAGAAVGDPPMPRARAPGGLLDRQRACPRGQSGRAGR